MVRESEVSDLKPVSPRLLTALFERWILQGCVDVDVISIVSLQVVLEPVGAPPPPDLRTPPYLTAQPEVFYHKLTANDKFLVGYRLSSFHFSIPFPFQLW